MTANVTDMLFEWEARDPDCVGLVTYGPDPTSAASDDNLGPSDHAPDAAGAAPRRGADTVDEPGWGRRNEHRYGDLAAGARRVATVLVTRGCAPGARVALLASNGLAFVEAFFGVLAAGGTVVPIPTNSAPPEIATRVERTGAIALLHDAGHVDLARAGAGARCPSMDIGNLAATGIGEPRGARAVLAAEATTAAAMILFTSGTTSRAQGVVISHRSLLAHTEALVSDALGLHREDRVLGILPLAHSFGCRMALLAPLRVGARVVLMSRFSAKDALAVLAREAITWLPAVPTMFVAMAQTEGPEFSSLRWCLSAGAPLPASVRLQAQQRLGAPIHQGYGLTEATFSTMDRPGDPDGDPERFAAVGRPVAGVEVELESEEGIRIRAGDRRSEAIGEILIRGDNLMDGYLDDAAATAAVLRGDWLATGDIGRFDLAGRLHVIDRKKDIILHGGNNVFPAEIEAALVSHPDVDDAAVVGQPDPYYGERIVAVVVTRAATADRAPNDPRDRVRELVEHLAVRIGRHKMPSSYTFIERLPLGPSRKVLRRALRQQVIDGALELLEPPPERGAAR